MNKAPDVRYVLLPPCTVAAYHYIGENPEEKAGEVLDRFVRESRLYEIKPDARMFGFNHPNSHVRADGVYGYEVWATVPDDMDIPKPMSGCLEEHLNWIYASHMGPENGIDGQIDLLLPIKNVIRQDKDSTLV